MDEGWRVKVSDFGLSRMLEDALVTTMTVCGTPCWTAPEVLRNQKYSGMHGNLVSLQGDTNR